MTFYGLSGRDDDLSLIKDIAIAPTAEELVGGADKVRRSLGPLSEARFS